MCSFKMKLATSTALLLLLSGCTLKQDVETICTAPVKSGVADEPDPTLRSKKLARYIDENLKTSEGREFFRALAPAAPATKVEFFERVIAESEYQGDCPMLDEMKGAAKREAEFKAELAVICAAPRSNDDTQDPAEHLAATITLIKKTAKSERSKVLLGLLDAKKYGEAADVLSAKSYLLDGATCELQEYLSRQAKEAK